MVKVKLVGMRKRPAFRLPDDHSVICLLDTGALMCVWCLPIFYLKLSYPDAVKTKYYTTVSGFGGVSIKKREVWKIPSFVIGDKNSKDKYEIRNLLVAIVDDTRFTSFNMVLSSLVFHGSSYRIYDETWDKHLEIYPSKDRAVYCVPEGAKDPELYGIDIQGLINVEENETLIEGISVFVEE